MPSMPMISSSSGCVIEVSTTSGAAPRYTVDTETTGGSTSGSSRFGRSESEMPPKTRITSDRTVERTGRLMQAWENFTASPPGDLLPPGGSLAD